MRLALTGTVIVALAVLAYVATPFWAAWTLREAIRTGDTVTLERKVDWNGVRGSLKASLAKHANLMPEINPEADPVKPGLWQRIKLSFGQSMLDSFVERYVTPTGLPQLFEYRQTYNSTVRRAEMEEERSLSSRERFQRFWSRLKRAEFQSPTRMELEVQDRRNPGRHYVSVLEVRDWEWKLVGLRVIAAPTSVDFIATPRAITASGSR